MSHEIDVSAFKQFEHDRWDQSVDAFDTLFGPLTRAMEPEVLRALAPRAGEAALDLATGPGYIAAAFAQLGCRATGLDISEAMIAQARRSHPASAIDFVVGDAEHLPFPDQTFDLAAMNFGILHLPQPQQAVHEAFRVLRPGARFAFTVWSTPEESRGFEIALHALELHGSPDVKLPVGPPFFRYSHRLEGLELLLQAGFDEPEAHQTKLVWRLPSPEALFRAFHDGTARTGGAMRAQPAANLERIRAAIVAEASEHVTEDGIAVPMAAWCYAGRKA